MYCCVDVMRNWADSVEDKIEFKYTLHCIKVGRWLPNATKEILRVQTDANHAESGSNARRPFGDGTGDPEILESRVDDVLRSNCFDQLWNQRNIVFGLEDYNIPLGGPQNASVQRTPSDKPSIAWGFAIRSPLLYISFVTEGSTESQ